MSDKKKQSPKAEEPTADYAKKRIVFFKSFEEMNEYDIEEMASHSPIERLRNVTSLIKQLYAEELSKNKIDKKLHFVKNESSAE